MKYGCFNETNSQQYVPSMEPEPGENDVTAWKKRRKLKCAEMAEMKGFNAFALWDGVCKFSEDLVNIYEQKAKKINCLDVPTIGTNTTTSVYTFTKAGRMTLLHRVHFKKV